MSSDTIRPPRIASILFLAEISATANDIQPQIRQTGNTPISKHPFDIS